MNWRLKAGVQNAIAKLPSKLSYEVYYQVQRRFGGLKTINPLSRFRAGVAMIDRIRQQQRPFEGQTFLEVGTGRCLNLPIALWLCGAGHVITVDLNPYLMPELVFQSLAFMRENRAAVEDVFRDYARRPQFRERLARLLEAEGNLAQLLRELNIEYLAPADAAQLALPAQSVDYHVSFTVLEHIPPAVLRDILTEGRRLLRPDGLFVHCVDFSDHFSHSDPTISAVNFLRFDETEWDRYAGNRYMYHNRLRVDDFAELLAQTNVQVIALETKLNQKALDELHQGFPLADRFRHKTLEINATTGAWLVAAAAGHSPTDTRKLQLEATN